MEIKQLVKVQQIRKIYDYSRKHISAYISYSNSGFKFQGDVEIDESLFSHRAGDNKKRARPDSCSVLGSMREILVSSEFSLLNLVTNML